MTPITTKQSNIRIPNTERNRAEMEQSNGVNDHLVFSAQELEVADILIGMEGAVLDIDCNLRIPFQWGRKRKRSAINVPRFLSSSPPPTPTTLPPIRGGGGGEAEGEGVVVVASKVIAEVEASSPATPLSLSLTESEEKPFTTKASLKRQREYYQKVMEDLTKTQAALAKEVDNVKRYYEQLKAFNLKLKERKKELSNGSKSECKNNPNFGVGCQMQQQQLVNAQVAMAQTNQQYNQFQSQLQQHLLNQNSVTRSNEGIITQFQHVSMPPLTMVSTCSSNNIRPIGVLDLNVSPEESVHVEPSQPLDVNVTNANKDVSRAMAAQARQRRIQLHRLKNPIPNSKPRYSCR